jgi:hypothetical protein
MLIVGAVVLVVVLSSAIVLGKNKPGDGGDRFDKDDWVHGLEAVSESKPSSGELAVGANETIIIPQGTRIIKNLTAVLTWVDETQRPGMPRLRRYQNQPDSFSMSIDPHMGNQTQDGAGSNTIGGEGRIEIKISLSNDELNAAIDAARNAGTGLPDWSVEVVLTEAGDWSTLLPPHIIGFRDDANAYILEIEFQYYDLTEILTEILA